MRVCEVVCETFTARNFSQKLTSKIENKAIGDVFGSFSVINFLLKFYGEVVEQERCTSLSYGEIGDTLFLFEFTSSRSPMDLIFFRTKKTANPFFFR